LINSHTMLLLLYDIKTLSSVPGRNLGHGWAGQERATPPIRPPSSTSVSFVLMSLASLSPVEQILGRVVDRRQRHGHRTEIVPGCGAEILNPHPEVGRRP